MLTKPLCSLDFFAMMQSTANPQVLTCGKNSFCILLLGWQTLKKTLYWRNLKATTSKIYLYSWHLIPAVAYYSSLSLWQNQAYSRLKYAYTGCSVLNIQTRYASSNSDTYNILSKRTVRERWRHAAFLKYTKYARFILPTLLKSFCFTQI